MFHKSRLFTRATLVLFLATASAWVGAKQPSAPAKPAIQSTAKPAQPKFNWQHIELKSNVWKISKKGSQPSYLLGTLHVGKENSRFRPQIQDLVRQNQKVIFEAPVYWSEEKQATEILQHMPQMISPDTTLQAQMGEADFTELMRHLNEHAEMVPMMEMLNHFKPWAMNLMLAGMPKKGYSAKKGVEQGLIQAAKKHKKPMSHLENLDVSVALFQKMPDDVALANLVAAVKHRDIGLSLSHKINQAYAKGEFSRFPKLVQENIYTGLLPQTQQKWLENWFENDVVVQRNRAWLPKMKQEMRQQKTLFAVGLGHLMGDKGLIALLREQGYTVEPQEKLLIWR